MEKNKAKDGLLFFCGVVLAGCLIQIAGKAKGDEVLFPGALEIIRTFFRLLAQPKTYLLAAHSLVHLAASLAISTVLAVALGLLEGLSPLFQKLLSPLMIFLRSIPMIVLVVVIMVLCEYRFVPVVAASLVLIPLISESCAEGCRNIDPELIDVYRLNGGFSLGVLLDVYVPLIAGYLRSAYINAVGMGMKIVISSEYLVQSKNSLGKAIFSSAYFTEYSEIYAYALIMMLMVVAVSALSRLWEKKQ